MNDITAKENGKKALAIVTALTLFVAGFELFIAFSNYKPGMNFLDLTSYVLSNKYIYFMLLTVANLALLPAAVTLYKENGIRIKDEIIDKKSLGKDILIAAVAILASEAVQLLFSFTFKFRTGMAFQIESSLPADMIVLWIISLVFVSGIIKEIFYRGFAKRFLGPVIGEMPALLLFNVMFAVLDWHNYGLSFFLGLACIWAYKKTGRLLAPMLVHGMANLIALFYWIVVG